MRIKVPKYIFVNKDNKRYEYQLFVDFAKSSETPEWIWKISYVGDTGILYMKRNNKLGAIESDVFDFIETNKYEFE